MEYSKVLHPGTRLLCPPPLVYFRNCFALAVRQLAITAGIGSDHVDLSAAMERGIDVAEVTYSNSISVAGIAVACTMSSMIVTLLCRVESSDGEVDPIRWLTEKKSVQSTIISIK